MGNQMPMFAPYLKNLRVKLQEKKDAVLRAKPPYVESHLKTFLGFVSTQPVLSSLTAELECLWSVQEKEELFKQLDGSRHDIAKNLPHEEIKRAAYVIAVSKFLLDPSYSGDLWQKVVSAFEGSDADEAFEEYRDQLFLSLYHYYDERIDDVDLVLYLLLKYKRVSEWFDRERLFELSNEDTRHREASLDSDLRKFLTQQGIDYPFSTPSSPKGKTDILIKIDEKPLPIEVKIFDGQSYGKSYLKKGLNQALKYAEDYNQPVGYLVIFNLSETLLQFGIEVTQDYFPKISAQNKTVFFVTVNIHPITLTASQEKEAKIVILEEDYLISAEA